MWDSIEESCSSDRVLWIFLCINFLQTKAYYFPRVTRFFKWEIILVILERDCRPEIVVKGARGGHHFSVGLCFPVPPFTIIRSLHCSPAALYSETIKYVYEWNPSLVKYIFSIPLLQPRAYPITSFSSPFALFEFWSKCFSFVPHNIIHCKSRIKFPTCYVMYFFLDYLKKKIVFFDPRNTVGFLCDYKKSRPGREIVS